MRDHNNAAYVVYPIHPVTTDLSNGEHKSNFANVWMFIKMFAYFLHISRLLYQCQFDLTIRHYLKTASYSAGRLLIEASRIKCLTVCRAFSTALHYKRVLLRQKEQLCLPNPQRCGS